MEPMPMRQLNEHQLQQIIDWLKIHNITYNEKRLLQDFSDCVNVAKILKTIHPKHVEMHNYPPRSNTDLKLNNWQTLNFKVLNKIGLTQSQKRLEKLARGNQQAIENLLYDVMRHERVDRLKRATIEEQERNWIENNNEIMKINVNKRIGDALIQVPQKMILYSSYEDALKRRDALLNANQDMEKTIHQLEKLLEVKNKCIEDLCGQVSMHTTVTQSKAKKDAEENPKMPEEIVREGNIINKEQQHQRFQDSISIPILNFAQPKSDGDDNSNHLEELKMQQNKETDKLIKAALSEAAIVLGGGGGSSRSTTSSMVSIPSKVTETSSTDI